MLMTMIEDAGGGDTEKNDSFERLLGSRYSRKRTLKLVILEKSSKNYTNCIFFGKKATKYALRTTFLVVLTWGKGVFERGIFVELHKFDGYFGISVFEWQKWQ